MAGGGFATRRVSEDIPVVDLQGNQLIAAGPQE